MSTTSIMFAGFGGQGLLFSGKVAATAGLIDGREVTWLPSYGPEMRGGTANCSVRISDLPIGSPLVWEPDILVAMNTPSYAKFIGHVAPGGIVITDSSLVKCDPHRDGVSIFEVDATRISGEEGLDGISNMILLGKLVKESDVISIETMERAVRKCVPKSKSRLLEGNIRAIRLGMTL
ncbi:MAG: 2-oxoacid:acceptor oxidoreductase family protein [Synergistaceae bacterium]|jgi:2-oxoglutarate ferredoxin oxidoreductase subunit gamma|nr:2-oxoacid:acceptor oxidoreductase family protein [Synergistaceae bacterium]